MPPPRLRTPIAIVQEPRGSQRLAGLDEALRRRGAEPMWLLAEETPHRLTESTRVVVVAETRSFASRYALRRASMVGACTVLVPGGPSGPAPVDVIAPQGSDDDVARLLLELTRRPARKRTPAPELDPVRLPPRLAAVPGRPRVVSLVRCGDSPVGGVTTWSLRLAAAFAQEDLGYDVRTLLVVTHPDAIPQAELCDDGLTHTCVVDPMADQWEVIRTLRRAIERLQPAIVLPNYADLCYAAAMQLRPRGVRTIAIAHTDHDVSRDLFELYDRWDGAAGVSGACMSWLTPLAAGRPVSKIVYGVPVRDAPRSVEPAGPLKLAYIGRMVVAQKRIGDLLAVIDGLERLGARYELNLVGDGEDLDAWLRRLAERRLRHGRVIAHGRRSPEWVQRFLGEIDVSVLVSDYEGTSITMLESMGAGVVPAVTRVSSGVDEWIRDGDNGVIVPIGDPDRMAARLAALASDRSRIAAMGAAAWDTVRGPLGIESMARQYRALFDEVMRRPVDRTPTDTGLRLCDRYTWSREWVERPDEALSWIASVMREAGYRNIALDDPAPGCDAVIVRARGAEPVEHRVAGYRRAGLGVAVSPHLIEAPVTNRMHRLVLDAVERGCRRVAVYGFGRHTRRTAEIFNRGLPIVGLIDDDPPAARRAFGLPIVPLDRAMTELAPDAVLLSSDAWEEQMWRRCSILRSAGVRVIPVYGRYREEAPTAGGPAR